MEIVKNSAEMLIIKMKADLELANAIRRSVSEVPTLAIDEVEIYKNDSALYDEVLALRLGLIPLKTEKGMNEKTKIDFKLAAKGPRTVYSADLKGNADVVFDKIPITILGEDNKLELVATATLGKAMDHAKYQPGLAYYRYILEVKSSPEIDKNILKSKGLLKPEKKGNKWFCDLNEVDREDIKLKDKSAVNESDEILFIVESYGNMPAKDIFVKAIRALSDNLDEVEKAVK